MFDVLLPLLLFLASAGGALGQPVITNQPQTQATAPGTSATFTVGARGTAPLAYQWRKDVGAGWSDITDGTNATLVLTNVQSWDAGDYRVVVTNIAGARTSAVAHLYVMRFAPVSTNIFADNFDDNKITGWSLMIVNGTGWLRETNGQFTVYGSWPGVRTIGPADTMATGLISKNWSMADGQTIEFRFDEVALSENGTNCTIFEIVHQSNTSSYTFLTGPDWIRIGKYVSGSIAFWFERAPIRHTNVVLSFALTRAAANVILTARVLDKENPNAVLYQHSVVDTPAADPTLSQAQIRELFGIDVVQGPDVAGTPFTSGAGVSLGLWQYTDGHQPPAQVTYDNFEIRKYDPVLTRYVDAGSTNATPPYATWTTAATNIQDAVDAALAGDEIVVTNGTYATGGRAVYGTMTNRLAVDKPLTVRSVNGPQFTVIQGHQAPGTTNGDGAIRCVYLTNGASLSGFTLTNGATRIWTEGIDQREVSGGGVWSESATAMVSNCVVAGNSAYYGGGAWGSSLSNCTLTRNSAERGGGAFGSTLSNCTLTGNSASSHGGGASACTLNNCIVYYNTAPVAGANYAGGPLNYCCTTPDPGGFGNGGFGNITNQPLFLNQPAGNLRLQTNSPCINAGSNAYVTNSTDLDGLPRIVSGTVDIGAYEFQGPGSVISYAWLQQYGLPTDGSADATDPDADGLNNWQEWRCLTDPTNALSVLSLLAASSDGTNVTVSWQSVAGVSYFLERSTDLAATPPFTLVATNLVGQTGTNTFTDTNTVALPRLFYRLGVGN